ncbi:NnrS family protein [Shewanella sp. GXUN23E]|uniref:NnrS family protein n=1 Tax=Shewanella sp. GXUN23E TaxID=3422498 RepID=UPI003D7D4F44
MLQIHDPLAKQPNPPLFRLGFRPLFLFGSLFSILALTLWLGQLNGVIFLTPQGNVLWWHGHEMIFGFVAAIVAGFLLTAVQNWTGSPGLSGKPLVALFGLWLVPRILLLDNHWAPLPLVAAIDLAFLPATAWVVGHAVYQVKQWRNMVFVPILCTLTLLNAISYYGLLYGPDAIAHSALYAATLLIVLLIALLGGRVIPFFTERATQWQRGANIPLLEGITFGAILVLVLTMISQQPLLIRLAAAVGAALLLIRQLRWGIRHCLPNPLLWSLHLSYLCIPTGLLLIAAGLPISAGFHLMAVGGVGGMILAMMARVSLGHTGRPLKAPAVMPYCFAFLLLGAGLRAMASIVPTFFQLGVLLAAIAWLLAFGGFCLVYARMLCSPRADGKAG